MNVVAVGMHAAKVLLMAVAVASALTTQKMRPRNHRRHQAAQQDRRHQKRPQKLDQNRPYFKMSLQTYWKINQDVL